MIGTVVWLSSCAVAIPVVVLLVILAVQLRRQD